MTSFQRDSARSHAGELLRRSRPAGLPEYFRESRRSQRFKIVYVFVVILSGAWAVGDARSQTKVWVNPGTGIWAEPSNWSPSGSPGSTNDAEVSNGGIVQYQNFASITEARAQDVYLGRNGGVGELQVNNFFNLITRDGWVGYSGIGRATVSGVGTFGSPAYWSTRNLSVGNLSSGTLNILNGGLVETSNVSTIAEGASSTSTVNVRGAGSEWRAGSSLTVGIKGAGNLNIEAGGKVSDQIGAIGLEPEGESAVTVTGTGSQWYHGDALIVGADGLGELDIGDGGLVSTIGPCSIAELTPGAEFEDSGGIIEVKDTGSKLDIGTDFFIGNGGQGGIINILNGGQISSDRAYVGNYGPSFASIVVDGQGSTWTNSVQLFLAYAGTADLTVKNGGTVATPNASLGNLALSNGAATVGAGGTWSNQFLLEVGKKGKGRVDVIGGGTLTSGQGNIGGDSEAATTADGSVYVSGAGSTWTSSGTVTVGYKNLGKLQVDSGGVVKSNGGRVGFLSSSQGTAIIDGVGSKWEITGTLTIGRTASPGTGVMTIRNGGLVTVSGGTSIRLTGRLDGNGTISGAVTNQGVVAPGNSPGTLHISGDYTQSSTGKLAIELASASSYDVLTTTGLATLAGNLEINLLNGFLPSASDTFNIVSAASRAGTFDTVSVLSNSMPAGTFNIGYSANGITLSNFQSASTVNGPIAYWNAENGAADVTGNGHDGVFNGNATTVTSGPFGKAFTFDGSGDFINIGDELDMGTSDFTLAAYIKGDPSMDQWARIFDKGYASGYALGRRAFANTVGAEFLASGSQGNFFATTSSLIDNTWHHIALVKSGTTLTLYADGVAQNSETISGASQDNVLPLLIGFNPGEGLQGYWKGLLDELKVFNRALSASEVSLLASYLVGDFNSDGKVDAADYALWRKGLGTIYTQSDYNTWRTHFAQTVGSGTSSTAATIPEPTSAAFLVVTLLSVATLTPIRKLTRARYSPN